MERAVSYMKYTLNTAKFRTLLYCCCYKQFYYCHQSSPSNPQCCVVNTAQRIFVTFCFPGKKMNMDCIQNGFALLADTQTSEFRTFLAAISYFCGKEEKYGRDSNQPFLHEPKSAHLPIEL